MVQLNNTHHSKNQEDFTGVEKGNQTEANTEMVQISECSHSDFIFYYIYNILLKY
jgi:hypothetical protein